MATKLSRIILNCSKSFKLCRNFSQNVQSSLSGSKVKLPISILAAGTIQGPKLVMDNSVSNPLKIVTKPPGLWLSSGLVYGSPQPELPRPKPPIGMPLSIPLNPIGDRMYPNSFMEDPLPQKRESVIIEEAPEIRRGRLEKRAARLIIIRRRKMNRHKRIKNLKKMGRIIAKVKLRKEILKEKEFLDRMYAQIREAEAFDPKAHVAQLIAKAKEIKIPRRIKGKLLPEWYIRQQLELGKLKLPSK